MLVDKKNIKINGHQQEIYKREKYNLWTNELGPQKKQRNVNNKLAVSTY